MKNRWIMGVIIVLLLLIGLTSCREKVPPGLSSEILSNKQMGYSLRYPQDWYHDWVNKNRGLRLSPLEYPDDDPTILALDISMTIFSKDELQSMDQGTGARDALQMITTNFDFGPDGQVTFGDINDFSLSSKDAYKVEFSGVTRAGDLAGQVTTIDLDDRIMLILGSGPQEEWQNFQPVFTSLLDSLSFFTPNPNADAPK